MAGKWLVIVIGLAGTMPLPAAQPFHEELVSAARLHGLSVELVQAVVLAESGGNPRAISPKGARGLMQLMPGTAEEMGVTDPFDPEQNLMGGCRYLREQLDRFGSLDLALAAYNAGPTAVERWGGVPGFEETQQYVDKILAKLGRSRTLRLARLHQPTGSSLVVFGEPQHEVRARPTGSMIVFGGS